MSGVGATDTGAEGVGVVGGTGVVVSGVGEIAGAGVPTGGVGVAVSGAGVAGAALGSGTVSYIVLSGNWTLPITLPCIAHQPVMQNLSIQLLQGQSQ